MTCAFPTCHDRRLILSAGNGLPSLCLWQNQNLHTENVKAAIKFGEGDFFSSGDGIRVTFEILGGVDFPRLIISLRIPEHGASMHAVFRPWHPNFRSFPNPSVHLNNLNSVGELLGRFFGFSERMHSLTVQVDSPELWLRTALGLTGT